MRFKLVVFSCLLVSLVVQAQSKKNTAPAAQNQSVTAPVPTVNNKAGMVMKGVNVGLLLSTASELEVTGRLKAFDRDINVKSKFNGESAPGFGVRYAQVPVRGVGFIVGGAYHFSREVKSVDVTGNVFGQTVSRRVNFNGVPKVSLLVIEPNAAIGIQDHLYILAGPNYVYPIKSGNWEGADIKGDLGVQFGGGFAYNQFFGEIQYQTLNPKYEEPNLSVDESRLWGFVIRAGATF